MTERTLDWVPRHDPASRSWPIRTLIGTPPIQKRLWRPGIVLDQGREGACVGFGWAGELIGSPRPDRTVSAAEANAYARSIYRRAQQVDEWEGENYEGTSVLAGAKVVQRLGHIENYRWAFSIADVRDAIIAEGPVVIGVPWYSGMYSTDPNGIVDISGEMVGGHCLFVYEYHPAKRIPGHWNSRHAVFRWRNSWGPSYGKGGSGYIRYDDLAHLLAQRGEACVPINRRKVRL